MIVLPLLCSMHSDNALIILCSLCVASTLPTLQVILIHLWEAFPDLTTGQTPLFSINSPLLGLGTLLG
jgi:hypothetical protein